MRHRQQRVEFSRRQRVGINHGHASVEFIDDRHGHQQPARFRNDGQQRAARIEQQRQRLLGDTIR
jgi:hypothetical protein